MTEDDALVARLESLVAEWESGQIADHKVGRWAISDLHSVLASRPTAEPDRLRGGCLKGPFHD